MNISATRFLGLTSAIVATVAVASWVPAEAGSTHANAVTALVTRASQDPASEAPESLPFALEGSTLKAEGDGITVEAPAGNSGTISIGSDGENSLVVTLPEVDVTSADLNSAASAAVYSAAGNYTDVSVQPFADGAQVSTVPNSASAPTEFDYSFQPPAGGRVVLDGQLAMVLDANDEPVGFVGRPWAVDAAGRTIDSHFELNGSLLTQVVEHRVAGVTYPVVADPYLGKSMIKKAVWEWVPRNGSIGAGWTFNVTPTRWARLNAGGYLPGVYGWRELHKKYKKYGLWHNLGGMKDQFICHQQVVALRAPNKPTWNLDEWRKNVSYYSTVRSSCNPPRGGAYAYAR